MELLNKFGLVETFLSLLLLLLTIKFLKHGRKTPNYPPGPSWALPLIGNMLQLGSKPHLTFKNWKLKYGPIFSFQMGSDRAVVISDGKLLKELFSSFVATGKPQSPFFTVFGEGKFGVLNAEGENWEAQRRFTLRTLKDLGLSNGILEGIIVDEAKSILSFFDKRIGTPIYGNRIFNAPVVNSLWTIVSGERHEWNGLEEPECVRKPGEMMDASNTCVKTGVAFAPWLRHFAPELTGWNNFVKAVRSFEQATNETLSHHEAKLNESSANDFIDCYLHHMQGITDPSSSFYKETGKKNLQNTLADLFVAGSETTSLTLEYALLYLSQNKQAQQKSHEELDRVIGMSQFPCLSDRQSLPYMEAVIMEVLRCSSIVSMGAPHRMLEDMEFHGYFLPKDSIVIPDIYNILHDPITWGPDAHKFKPERFLNEDETKVIRNDALIPFSTGKRQCIGESLAKDTAFLFLTCILQKFCVEEDSTSEKVDMDDPIPGFLLQLKPFKLVFNKR